MQGHQRWGTGLELSTLYSFIQVNVMAASSKLAASAISNKAHSLWTFSKFGKLYNYGRYYGRSFLTFKAKKFYHNFVGRKHVNVVPNGCSTLRDVPTALSQTVCSTHLWWSSWNIVSGCHGNIDFILIPEWSSIPK